MTTAASEPYLAARDEALAAARELTRGKGVFRTPDGTVLRVSFRTPLRVLLLLIDRKLPGQAQATGFSFQRDGRVVLSGDRKIPLREAAARGHDAWASREELQELAGQLHAACAVSGSERRKPRPHSTR